MEVSIFAAFVAGLVSFLSPCVLPLVPGYMSMLSGIGVEQLKGSQAHRAKLLLSALAFVFGFSIVFISFGASASAVGTFFVRNRSLLAPVAGALIVMFGLHLIGWLGKIQFRVGLMVGGSACGHRSRAYCPSGASWRLAQASPFLFCLVDFSSRPFAHALAESRHTFPETWRQPGAFGGFLMGFAFAFGWTPCIGPILATVLAIAATRETIGQGVFLLACYSAGLAIPFLVTALLISGFLRFYQGFRRYLHMVEVFSGVLLLAIGGLVFLNRLTWLSGKLTFLNRFSL